MDRDPAHNLPQDICLQKLIRRANLDALWSREPLTVLGTLLAYKQGAQIATSLGFREKLFKPMGPFPLEDTFGMGEALVMLHNPCSQGNMIKPFSLAPSGSSGVLLAMSTMDSRPW